MFVDGEIAAHDNPKKVHTSNPVFLVHKLEIFEFGSIDSKKSMDFWEWVDTLRLSCQLFPLFNAYLATIFIKL